MPAAAAPYSPADYKHSPYYPAYYSDSYSLVASAVVVVVEYSFVVAVVVAEQLAYYYFADYCWRRSCWSCMEGFGNFVVVVGVG